MRLVKKAIGNKIIGGKLHTPQVSEIVMPEATVQKNMTVVVNSKGPHVSNNIKLGCVLMVYGGVKQLIFHREINGEPTNITEYLFSEEDILMIKIGKIFRPFGKYVLIERINEEQKVGGIIIPSAYKTTDQSLFGVVVLNGWHNDKEIDSNVQPGDIVHIAKWDMTIKEIEIGGKYHLLVPMKLIDYKTNQNGLSENYVSSCLV